MSAAKSMIRVLVPRSLRNWLRSPARSTAWMWNKVRYSLGQVQTIEIRPGWALRSHPAAYRFSYTAQIDDPEQRAEIDGFIATATAGMVLFDIGAHFGLFSLAALHYGGREAVAFAVDPSPAATEMMRTQARINGLQERMHIVEAAVGDQVGEQAMISVGVLSSGYFIPPTKNHPETELTRTAAITVDQLAKQAGVKPTHVKIDVEGFEAAVVRGAKQVLSDSPAPVVFIEIHNKMVREREGDPAEALGLLEELGYEFLTVDGAPIERRAILEPDVVRIMARRTAR